MFFVADIASLEMFTVKERKEEGLKKPWVLFILATIASPTNVFVGILCLFIRLDNQFWTVFSCQKIMKSRQ